MRGYGFLLILAIAAYGAASDPIVPGKKLSTPPTIDGTITDAEWNEAASSSGYVDGQTGGAVASTGTFWLAYDADAIYFASRIQEPDPRAIRASETRTNVQMNGDDTVSLILDAFGRTGNYNIFSMNAAGGTNIRISGGRAAKREWLGEIVAKGRITDTGWEAEARIPWGVMRLPSPGNRDLSFNIIRWDPRTQRELWWRYSPNTDEGFGRWTGVDVPKSGNQRSLKLLPYVFGGYDEDKGHVANAGLDFKSTLTDQIDVVGSVNPDFRNIENQILSLDFSRFERLAGESRPFFLEGQEYFRTSGDSPLFSPQRIRKFDAGFKAYGKLDTKTRFAFLNTADFGKENALVANVRHQATPTFGVTASVASYDKQNLHNLGTFLAADYSIGPVFFFGQNMYTKDTIAGHARRYNTGVGYFANGIEAIVEYYHISDGFLPRIGFAPERNFKGVNANLGITKPIAKGPFMEAGIGINGLDYARLDGSPYRRSLGVNTSLTTRHALDIDTGVEFEEFLGSKDHRYFFSVEHPRGDPYRRWQLDYVFGKVAGADFKLYNAVVAYRPLKPLQLSFSYQHIKHFTNSTQAILGLNYELNASDSISGRAVKRDKDVNFYLAWRRSGNKGAEYFLILGDPNASKFRTALVAKVVVPFEVKF